MPVRPALPADIPTLSTTAATTFIDDSVIAHLLHPHRRAYPSDWLFSWTRRFRASIASPTRACIVAVDETGRVVGIAEWERWREGGKTKRDVQARGWGVQSAYVSAWNWATSVLWPDRSADPTQARVLAATFPLIAHAWGGERAESWYLPLLCVAPEWQGRGFGRELLEWGIQRAAEEGVGASLICADGKEGFYARHGFVEGGRANVGELAGLSGGAIMFRDAERGGE